VVGGVGWFTTEAKYQYLCDGPVTSSSKAVTATLPRSTS
jgi:hypothetical protein